MDLPADIINKITVVASYIGDATDQWTRIKLQLCMNMHPSQRSLFSRRHPVTKKQVPNEFDEAVIAKWTELTGVELDLNLHPADWVARPWGWTLKRGKVRYEDRQT